MNYLANNDYNFGIIPKSAEESFVENTFKWYLGAVEDEIPTLTNNMFYENANARDSLLWFINEVGSYYYASSKIKTFDKNQFPATLQLTDQQFDERINYFMDAYNDYLEVAFISDIKKVMNKHALFHLDQYSYDADYKSVKPVFVNKPIVEVW